MRQLPHCPGTVEDIDPAWSHDRATRTEEILERHTTEDLNLEIDRGGRALISDLNEERLRTRTSNLSCGGTEDIFQPYIIFGTEEVPDDVVDEIGERAPQGWEARQNGGLVYVTPEECGEMERRSECGVDVTPEERQQVDRAFVTGIREVYDLPRSR